MSKLVVLTRERKSENWKQMDYFIAQDGVKEPEEAMRYAINDFLYTPEGKKEISNTFGEFNWGDAISSVPDEIWNKFGLEIKYDNQQYMISGGTSEINVDQDEVLVYSKNLASL